MGHWAEPPPPFPAVSVPGPPAIDGLGELEAPWQPSPPCSLERAPPSPLPGEGGRTVYLEVLGFRLLLK